MCEIMKMLEEKMREREMGIVRALSQKYNFSELEGQEYIKMHEIGVGVSVGVGLVEKKQGRPSTQRVENEKETEDESFCALVERSEKSGRVEYKKLEKKVSVKKEVPEVVPEVVVSEVGGLPVVEKKVVKKSLKKVVVTAPVVVAPVVVEPVAVVVEPVAVVAPAVVVASVVVAPVVVKEKKKKAEKVDTKAKDLEVAEIIARAQAAKEAAKEAAAAKAKDVKSVAVSVAVVVPSVPVVPKKSAKKSEKVVEKVAEKVVPSLFLPEVVSGAVPTYHFAAPPPELEEEEVPEEVSKEESIRHEGTMYLKSKEGIVYGVFSREKVGRVDSSGKVILDAQAQEEELCTESEDSSEDETVLMTDSEDEE